MTQTHGRSKEATRLTFEDLLVRQAELTRELAREHERAVASLQRELEALRNSQLKASLGKVKTDCSSPPIEPDSTEQNGRPQLRKQATGFIRTSDSPLETVKLDDNILPTESDSTQKPSRPQLKKQGTGFIRSTDSPVDSVKLDCGDSPPLESDSTQKPSRPQLKKQGTGFIRSTDSPIDTVKLDCPPMESDSMQKPSRPQLKKQGTGFIRSTDSPDDTVKLDCPPTESDSTQKPSRPQLKKQGTGFIRSVDSPVDSVKLDSEVSQSEDDTPKLPSRPQLKKQGTGFVRSADSPADESVTFASTASEPNNGPAKSAWSPAPPALQSRPHPPPLQTGRGSTGSTGRGPTCLAPRSTCVSEPVTPQLSPRGTKLSFQASSSQPASKRTSDARAVSVAEDNDVEVIPGPQSPTGNRQSLSGTRLSLQRPKSAGAELVHSFPHSRDGSLVEIEEPPTGSWKGELPIMTESTATHQLLNPQGFKKKKNRSTLPTEDRRTSVSESAKRLTLPGSVGSTIKKPESPDGSSSSDEQGEKSVMKSLSWAPSDCSRKPSLASLNPLNWLLSKDEGEAEPKMSITVAETDVVPADNSRRPSVASVSHNVGSRRPSLTVHAPRRPSISNGAGFRRPSVSGGSRRGSRRQSRLNTAPAGYGGQNIPLAKAKFDTWPVWSDVLNQDNHEAWERISNISRHSILVDAYRKLRSADFHRHHHDSDGIIYWLLQKMVMHPSSLKRMLWVSLSGLLITYDIIMTPLRVFDLKEEVFFRSANWVTLVFWTLDLFMSPFVGYHHQFNIEMRVKKTAFRYLTTWFGFDMFLVSADWILMAFGEIMGDKGMEGARTLRTAKTFRMARALRSLRLLRVVKMPDIIKDVTYLVGRSEYTSLTLGILKHLFGILLVNHLIACLWYLLGDDRTGWVPEYCSGCSVQMLYFTSLHWSLTQFTPATMTVQPMNFVERLFAVSVLLFALITFSSFVSSITNLMTHLRTLRSVEAKQYVKLERYLHDRGISFHLSVRVRRYLEHVMSERARYLEETDVELLHKLSTPLHMELRYEVHFPVLSKHPFFKHYSTFNLQVMQRLCLEALKTMNVGSGDSVFCVGDSAHSMYFIERGILLYSKQAAFTINAKPEMIESGNWCCEAVLWTPWEHCGEMRALTEASLLALQASKLHDIMSKNKTAATQPASYAAEVVDALNEIERQDLSDVDTKDQAIARVHMVKEAFEIEEESVTDSTQPATHQAHALRAYGGHVSEAFHKMAHKVAFGVGRGSRESTGSIGPIGGRNSPNSEAS